MNTINGLREFHGFVAEKLKNGGADLSPEEALDEWRELHPDSWETGDDLAAIQESLDDLANGDVPLSFEEFDREFRKQHNIPGPP